MADGQKKKPTVATPSGAYLRMLPRWKMMDALLGGTETMRAAGKEFLPQYENETNKNYDSRLSRATLLNMTEQTLDTLAGKPFREALVLGDDVPAEIEEFSEDIDMQGSNLQAFCRTWFREGWAKGFSHVLIDHPTPEEKVDGTGQVVPRTLADDRSDGMRPYWVHIKPECLIAAYSMVVDGQEVLTHVRIKEITVEKVGWEEVEVERVRVLEPGVWQLWAPDEKGDEWHVESEGTTSLDFIPLVTFYAGKRAGLMDAKPPLVDLAFLNVEHWQSKSDQRNVLTVSRFPILAAAGVPADQKVTIGPNNFLTTDAPDGKWYYVEHTGAAIAAGQTDLESLEDQMASYGAEYLRKKPGDETATGRALDSAESSSYLAATVRDFQDCVELAMQYTASWLGKDDGGSVQINDDVDLEEADAAELDTLNKARAARDISRKTYLDELQKRQILSDDFDEEADAQFLSEEAKDAMGDMFNGGQGTMTPPGQVPPGNQPPQPGNPPPQPAPTPNPDDE